MTTEFCYIRFSKKVLQVNLSMLFDSVNPDRCVAATSYFLLQEENPVTKQIIGQTMQCMLHACHTAI